MRKARVTALFLAASGLLWLALAYSLIRVDASPAPSGPRAPMSNDVSYEVSGAASPGDGNASQAGSTASSRFVTGLEDLPASLRDIEVDGALQVDAAGHLVLNAHVRRLFDFFLNAVGEETAATAIARIRAYIDAHLPETASADAHRVLDEYLALRGGMDAAQQQAEADNAGRDGGLPGALNDARRDEAPAAGATGLDELHLNAATLRARKQQLRELRQQFLSADVDEAFFASEDLYDDYSIARLELLENKSLTPPDRAARIALLEQTLPTDLRERIDSVTRYQTLASLVQDWKAAGGTAAGVRQIRENLVGAAAADRLEALDNERAQWTARVDQWLSLREDILNNRAYSAADRQAQVEARRAEFFRDNEIRRVQTFEQARLR